MCACLITFDQLRDHSAYFEHVEQRVGHLASGTSSPHTSKRGSPRRGKRYGNHGDESGGPDGDGPDDDDYDWRAEEFGLDEPDDLSAALAADDAWIQFIADLIASEFLADIECGRMPMTNGKRKPRLDDAVRDRLAGQFYEDIRR